MPRGIHVKHGRLYIQLQIRWSPRLTQVSALQAKGHSTSECDEDDASSESRNSRFEYIMHCNDAETRIRTINEGKVPVCRCQYSINFSFVKCVHLSAYDSMLGDSSVISLKLFEHPSSKHQISVFLSLICLYSISIPSCK